MAIRLTEARLRQIIREEARKLVEMGMGGPADAVKAALQEVIAACKSEVGSLDGLAASFYTALEANIDDGQGFGGRPGHVVGALGETWYYSKGQSLFGDPVDDNGAELKSIIMDPAVRKLALEASAAASTWASHLTPEEEMSLFEG
jgi:hypothetical protein